MMDTFAFRFKKLPWQVMAAADEITISHVGINTAWLLRGSRPQCDSFLRTPTMPMVRAMFNPNRAIVALKEPYDSNKVFLQQLLYTPFLHTTRYSTLNGYRTEAEARHV